MDRQGINGQTGQIKIQLGFMDGTGQNKINKRFADEAG